MAIIHISEAEAARDLAGLLAKVRAGEEVRIDSDDDTFTIVPAQRSEPPRLLYDAPAGIREGTSTPRPRKLSEAIRLAEARGSNITLDPDFGNDLEDVIRCHEHERLIDTWESS